MAHESIYSLRRPGFPKETIDDTSYRTNIEYVGIYTDLRAAGVQVGNLWGEYPGRVSVANLEPIEGTDRGILVVTVEAKAGSADYPLNAEGDLQETFEELDWVDVQRSLYEHPKFAVGGGGDYELTEDDVVNLKKWENEPSTVLKKAFKFSEISASGGTSEAELSDNAKMLAKGILRGIEYWPDKAPVLRRTQRYKNGPGPSSNAGQKDDPDGFTGLKPAGYEWINNTDRCTHRGGQKTFDREREWTGAKKVLIDRDEIFWS